MSLCPNIPDNMRKDVYSTRGSSGRTVSLAKLTTTTMYASVVRDQSPEFDNDVVLSILSHPNAQLHASEIGADSCSWLFTCIRKIAVSKY
jgi:hypothetical protein